MKNWQNLSGTTRVNCPNVMNKKQISYLTFCEKSSQLLTVQFTKLPSAYLPMAGMLLTDGSPIHGLRGFQELYQSSSWNSQKQ